MKPVLYVGAMLMVGATIYGFADYKKTSDTKEFKRMYDAEKKSEPAKASYVNVAANKIMSLAPVLPPPAINAVSLENESLPAKTFKKTKKKKLDYREFSRAPLRE